MDVDRIVLYRMAKGRMSCEAVFSIKDCTAGGYSVMEMRRQTVVAHLSSAAAYVFVRDGHQMG